MIKTSYVIPLILLLFIVACASSEAKRKTDNPVVHEVAGTVSLIFSPTALAKVPQPPIDVALILKAENSGIKSVHKLIDPDPIWDPSNDRVGVTLNNFIFNLEPGEYQILGFTVNSEIKLIQF